MATLQQVRAHNDEQLRIEAQRSALEQQRQAAQAQQQYGIASALSAQGATQQAALAAHGADVQARLHQVTLNQEEQARLTKMYHARASIEDNADLAPSERRMLITQLESGINPLENRQREQQILQSHVQTQAVFQQSQQQGQLFNQQQEWLARGVMGNLQVINDPITGQPGLFHVGPDGKIQQLDFGHQAEMHQANLEAVRARTEATQQGTQQQGQLFPGVMEQQQLHNAAAQQAIQQANQINPLDVQHRQLANQQLAQIVAQSPERFNMDMLRGVYDIAGLHQAIGERLRTENSNVNLHEANATIARARAAAEPTNIALGQAAQRASTDYQRAHADYMSQMVSNMPNVAEANRRDRADTQGVLLRNQHLANELSFAQGTGVPMAMAGQALNHIFGESERAIGHAASEVARLRAIYGDNAPEVRTAQDNLARLRANQQDQTSDRFESFLNTMRAAQGLPPRPPRQRGQQQQPNQQPQAPQPFDVNRPQTQTPLQRQAVGGFGAMAAQTARLAPAERRTALELVIQVRQMFARYGSLEAMPADVREQYVQALQRFQQIIGQPASQGNAAPSAFGAGGLGYGW